VLEEAPAQRILKVLPARTTFAGMRQVNSTVSPVPEVGAAAVIALRFWLESDHEDPSAQVNVRPVSFAKAESPYEKPEVGSSASVEQMYEYVGVGEEPVSQYGVR
jgi:hypothetical protein